MIVFKQYVGVKTVYARRMMRGAYNLFRGWQLPDNEDPRDDGYLIEDHSFAVQQDLVGKARGYVTWLPKDVFEKSYTERDVAFFGIGQAIDVLKQGGKVARDGWPTTSAYIVLVSGSAVTPSINDNYGNGDTITAVGDIIYILSSDNTLIPYTPTVADLSAQDWKVV